MSASNHSVPVRLAYAAGGGLALVLLALAATWLAARFGPLSGAALTAAVFGTCGLVTHWPRRTPRLTRPAGVQLPERTAGGLEPASIR